MFPVHFGMLWSFLIFQLDITHDRVFGTILILDRAKIRKSLSVIGSSAYARSEKEHLSKKSFFGIPNKMFTLVKQELGRF